MKSKENQTIIDNGDYEHEFGAYTKDILVRGGLFGSFTFSESENIVYEGGDFDNYTGIRSKSSVFKGGNYRDLTGLESKDSIVIGGSYGEQTLRSAESIKAYIQKAEDISSPISGYIIADDVGPIELSECSEDTFVYTTKENVSGKYKNNSAFVLKSDLEDILEEVEFEHFKGIDDYKTLSMAMDNLICRVDEVSLPSIKIDV